MAQDLASGPLQAVMNLFSRIFSGDGCPSVVEVLKLLICIPLNAALFSTNQAYLTNAVTQTHSVPLLRLSITPLLLAICLDCVLCTWIFDVPRDFG